MDQQLILGFNTVFSNKKNRVNGTRDDDVIDGDGRRDIVKSKAGDDIVNTGAGNDFVLAGTGDDFVNGGADDDLLSGGDGRDTFIFTGEFGDDVVLDFSSGRGVEDVLLIDVASFDSVADVLSAAEQDGENTVIALGTAGTITLENVQASQLHQDDFMIA